MPVYPSISEDNADLIAVLTLLVEHHFEGVAESSRLVAFYFGFAPQYIHSVDLYFHWVEGDGVG